MRAWLRWYRQVRALEKEAWRAHARWLELARQGPPWTPKAELEDAWKVYEETAADAIRLRRRGPSMIP